jgi:hypothetical protein
LNTLTLPLPEVVVQKTSISRGIVRLYTEIVYNI